MIYEIFQVAALGRGDSTGMEGIVYQTAKREDDEEEDMCNEAMMACITAVVRRREARGNIVQQNS